MNAFTALNVSGIKKTNNQKEAAYKLAGEYRSSLSNNNRNKLINMFFRTSTNINNINRARANINKAVPPGPFRTKPGRFKQYLKSIRRPMPKNPNNINKMIRKEREIGQLLGYITRNGDKRAIYNQRLANIRGLNTVSNRLKELENLLRNMQKNVKRPSRQ